MSLAWGAEHIGGLILAPFVGSFLGVLADRLPRGEPVVVARSRCPDCATPLTFADLVPLVSWLASRGRCRHCGKPVSTWYPAIELASVAVALWAALTDAGTAFWIDCALGWTLLCLAAADLRSGLLPDLLTLPLVLAGLAITWMIAPDRLADHVTGAAAGYTALFLVNVAYRRVRGIDGLGMGDAKLTGAAGAWLGWQALAGLVLVAGVAALAVAVTGALAGRGLSSRARVNFGPYLCLAFWIAWLHGPLLLGGP